MSNENGKRRIDLLQPTDEEQLFSQSDLHHVQRPGGVRGAYDRSGLDMAEGGLYSPPRVTPGGWKEIWAATVAAGAPQGLPVEEGLEFHSQTFFCDNWTNQWLYEDNIKRYIPPYSGGWVFNMPSGAQKAQLRAKVPSAAYAPAAAIAGEYVWAAWCEAYVPPQTGGIDRTIAPVVSNPAVITSADTVNVSNRTYINAASGNVANGAAVATLLGAAGVRTWISGFECTATGSTAVLIVLVTVANVVTGTLTYIFVFPAGVTTPANSLLVEFTYPIPSNAVNTNIVVTLPAGGAGNTNAATVAHGFLE